MHNEPDDQFDDMIDFEKIAQVAQAGVAVVDTATLSHPSDTDDVAGQPAPEPKTTKDDDSGEYYGSDYAAFMPADDPVTPEEPAPTVQKDPDEYQAKTSPKEEKEDDLVVPKDLWGSEILDKAALPEEAPKAASIIQGVTLDTEEKPEKEAGFSLPETKENSDFETEVPEEEKKEDRFAASGLWEPEEGALKPLVENESLKKDPEKNGTEPTVSELINRKGQFVWPEERGKSEGSVPPLAKEKAGLVIDLNKTAEEILNQDGPHIGRSFSLGSNNAVISDPAPAQAAAPSDDPVLTAAPDDFTKDDAVVQPAPKSQGQASPYAWEEKTGTKEPVLEDAPASLPVETAASVQTVPATVAPAKDTEPEVKVPEAEITFVVPESQGDLPQRQASEPIKTPTEDDDITFVTPAEKSVPAKVVQAEPEVPEQEEADHFGKSVIQPQGQTTRAAISTDFFPSSSGPAIVTSHPLTEMAAEKAESPEPAVGVGEFGDGEVEEEDYLEPEMPYHGKVIAPGPADGVSIIKKSGNFHAGFGEAIKEETYPQIKKENAPVLEGGTEMEEMPVVDLDEVTNRVAQGQKPVEVVEEQPAETEEATEVAEAVEDLPKEEIPESLSVVLDDVEEEEELELEREVLSRPMKNPDDLSDDVPLPPYAAEAVGGDGLEALLASVADKAPAAEGGASLLDQALLEINKSATRDEALDIIAKANDEKKLYDADSVDFHFANIQGTVGPKAEPEKKEEPKLPQLPEMPAVAPAPAQAPENQPVPVKVNVQMPAPAQAPANPISKLLEEDESRSHHLDFTGANANIAVPDQMPGSSGVKDIFITIVKVIFLVAFVVTLAVFGFKMWGNIKGM